MKSLNKRMQEGVDLARHPEIQWWVVTGRFLDAAHQLNPPSISQAAPPPRIRHRPRTLASNQGFVASQCMVSLLAQNNPSALWQCAMLQVLNPWCGWEVKYCNNQGCPCHKLRNMFECEQLNLFKKKWKYCVFLLHCMFAQLVTFICISESNSLHKMGLGTVMFCLFASIWICPGQLNNWHCLSVCPLETTNNQSHYMTNDYSDYNDYRDSDLDSRAI